MKPFSSYLPGRAELSNTLNWVHITERTWHLGTSLPIWVFHTGKHRSLTSTPLNISAPLFHLHCCSGFLLLYLLFASLTELGTWHTLPVSSLPVPERWPEESVFLHVKSETQCPDEGYSAVPPTHVLWALRAGVGDLLCQGPFVYS